jgi:hypothetical protein
LGIGAFLYEKGLTEVGNKNGGSKETPKRNGKATPAPATSDELPNLSDDLRNAVVQAFRSGMGDELITFEEGYAYLRKYASPKQANSLIRYPDLVEEFCDRVVVAEDDGDIRELVSELVGTAIRRFKDGEDWREHYDYDADDEDPFV